ncbi:hypothetical protein C2E23DRAFT_430593 [Lenzites betulinus]|nr:hypothetical protein C2E23DRAFT_430593 [Lenzites betulinus]
MSPQMVRLWQIGRDIYGCTPDRWGRRNIHLLTTFTSACIQVNLLIRTHAELCGHTRIYLDPVDSHWASASSSSAKLVPMLRLHRPHRDLSVVYYSCAESPGILSMLQNNLKFKLCRVAFCERSRGHHSVSSPIAHFRTRPREHSEDVPIHRAVCHSMAWDGKHRSSRRKERHRCCAGAARRGSQWILRHAVHITPIELCLRTNVHSTPTLICPRHSWACGGLAHHRFLIPSRIPASQLTRPPKLASYRHMMGWPVGCGHVRSRLYSTANQLEPRQCSAHRRHGTSPEADGSLSNSRSNCCAN